MSVTGQEQLRGVPSHDEAVTAARGFAALGDPTRVRLVLKLHDGEAAVQDLARALDVSVANVSKHLQVLYQSALVARRREGSFVHYSLSSGRVAALVERMFRVVADNAADVLASVSPEAYGGGWGD